MSVWLVGVHRHSYPKRFRHIVCEFCGEEFKSLGGRETHQISVSG